VLPLQSIASCDTACRIASLVEDVCSLPKSTISHQTGFQPLQHRAADISCLVICIRYEFGLAKTETMNCRVNSIPVEVGTQLIAPKLCLPTIGRVVDPRLFPRPRDTEFRRAN
jgi:hypothetical protein